MRLRAWSYLVCIGALVTHAACGFPDFQFLDDVGPGSGASSGTAGAAGTPTTSGSGGSTGTQGGGGGTMCRLGEAGVCGADMKCTIVDTATGAIGCGMAGPKAMWERCNLDSDCVDTTWCDLQRMVCKPFCQSINDCVFGQFMGECVVPNDDMGAPLPGSATVCISNCDPKSGSPCAINDTVTCIYAGNGTFDCARSENVPENGMCTTSSDCAASLLCISPGSCKFWCEANTFDCPFPLDLCGVLNPMIFYEGTEMGSCP